MLLNFISESVSELLDLKMESSDVMHSDEEYSSFKDFQHINIDLCLELICEHLDLGDLVMVADSCKQIKYVPHYYMPHWQQLDAKNQ